MSELSFLLDLLLNEKLSVKVKTKLTERIKEIESKFSTGQPIDTQRLFPKTAQAQSTQKILDEMAMHPVPVEAPQPSSFAAAQALNQRAEAIRIQTSGKPEQGRTSPRKF